MPSKKIIVTGASGYISSLLLPAFRDRYDLTLLDVKNTDRDGSVIDGIQIADLSDDDLDTYRSYFRGVDAVVHLAFHSSSSQRVDGWQQASYLSERNNLDLAQHAYQLSMEEGVRRVVVASSNHAADWYEHILRHRQLEMLSPDDKRLSDNWYGWAKASYELMGFMYATGSQGSELENVQIRIGAPRPIDGEKFRDDEAGYKRDLGAYISPRDLQQLFIKSIEAEDIEDAHGIPFQVFYGVSDNTRAFWALDNAREVIDYEPEDDSEIVFAEDIRKHLIEPGRIGRL